MGLFMSILTIEQRIEQKLDFILEKLGYVAEVVEKQPSISDQQRERRYHDFVRDRVPPHQALKFKTKAEHDKDIRKSIFGK